MHNVSSGNLDDLAILIHREFDVPIEYINPVQGLIERQKFCVAAHILENEPKPIDLRAVEREDVRLSHQKTASDFSGVQRRWSRERTSFAKVELWETERVWRYPRSRLDLFGRSHKRSQMSSSFFNQRSGLNLLVTSAVGQAEFANIEVG